MIPRIAPNSSTLDGTSSTPTEPGAVANGPLPIWTSELPLDQAPNGYVLTLDQSVFWVLFSKVMLAIAVMVAIAIGVYSVMNVPQELADSGANQLHEQQHVLVRTMQTTGAMLAVVVLPCVLGLLGSLFWLGSKDPRSRSRWSPASRVLMRLGVVSMLPICCFQLVAALATFVTPSQGPSGPSPMEDLVANTAASTPESGLAMWLGPIALLALVFCAAIGLLVMVFSTMAYCAVLAKRLGDEDLRGACTRNMILLPGCAVWVLGVGFCARWLSSPILVLSLAVLGPLVAVVLSTLVFMRLRSGIHQIIVRRSTPGAMSPVPIRRAA